jgi:hypothetical protein
MRIPHYPRIRRYSKDGNLKLREGLILCFFMRHSHDELSAAVTRALDLYLEAVGPEKLGWYVDMQPEYDPDEYNGVEPTMRPLDSTGWVRVREDLRDPANCVLQLEEHCTQVGGFHVEYYGRHRDTLSLTRWPDVVSAVSFWLPTELLEEQGSARVKELATAIARELPIESGYVSLAFNYLVHFKEVVQAVHEHCFRYPGLDVHDVSKASMEIGTRIRGAYWLNFYSAPVLERLGGVEGLRKQLGSPDVSIEEFGGGKALVSLGEDPETRDVERRSGMRPYRALARVLEPFLYEERPDWFGFSPEELRRWQRRFLEEP